MVTINDVEVDLDLDLDLLLTILGTSLINEFQVFFTPKHPSDSLFVYLNVFLVDCKFYLAEMNTFGDMMHSFPSFTLKTCLHFANKGHHSPRADEQL